MMAIVSINYWKWWLSVLGNWPKQILSLLLLQPFVHANIINMNIDLYIAKVDIFFYKI